MDKEKKKLDKSKLIAYTLDGILTINAIKDVVIGIKAHDIKGKSDGTSENKVGYEDINTRFNTKVHTNNFVVLHIKRRMYNDITALTNKLNKCKNDGISVSLVLDCDASSLSDIYMDIDYLESILTRFDIDMPIYINIDKIMSNKKLNNTMKKEIIESFLNKMDSSSFRIGLYGTDSNLSDLNNYLIDITNRGVFLVKDSEDIKYVGKTEITKSLNGEITSLENLSIVTDSNVIVPCSVKYIIGENESIHSIALKCGLSEEDLMRYNDVKEVHEGDSIYIPNLYEIIDTNTNLVSYNFGVSKGIDISDYQDSIDWDRVSETSDYVITEIARIKSDTYLDTVCDHIENIIASDIDLGLYMCLGGVEETDIVLDRVSKYLNRLDSELNEKHINIDKSMTPIFIDFELDNDSIDYYSITNGFKELCNSHGFTKVGIYGNSNTLKCISKSFKNNNSSLKNSDFYIWGAGGPNYKDESKWLNKGYKMSELEEVTISSNEDYDVDMMQVTNVCTDTGATNSMGHCDVSFLYNDSMFDNNDTEYNEYLEVDLNKYKNVPLETIIHGVQNTLTFFTALGYTVLFIKIIGKKLVMSIKKRKMINDEIKRELKK